MEIIEAFLSIALKQFSRFLPLIGSYLLFRLRFVVVKKAIRLLLSIGALLLLLVFALWLVKDLGSLTEVLSHG